MRAVESQSQCSQSLIGHLEVVSSLVSLVMFCFTEKKRKKKKTTTAPLTSSTQRLTPSFSRPWSINRSLFNFTVKVNFILYDPRWHLSVLLRTPESPKAVWWAHCTIGYAESFLTNGKSHFFNIFGGAHLSSSESQAKVQKAPGQRVFLFLFFTNKREHGHIWSRGCSWKNLSLSLSLSLSPPLSLSLSLSGQLMMSTDSCSGRRVYWVNQCVNCSLVHLIIRASIRKSISSCSEQISGRVCGAERIRAAVWGASRNTLSPGLLSGPMKRRNHVKFT